MTWIVYAIAGVGVTAIVGAGFLAIVLGLVAIGEHCLGADEDDPQAERGR